jgi:hypothetical protein
MAQTIYSDRPNASQFDDINEFASSLRDTWWTEIVRVRKLIDSDPGRGWLDATRFRAAIQEMHESKPGLLQKEVLGAAERLFEIGAEAYAKTVGPSGAP